MHSSSSVFHHDHNQEKTTGGVPFTASQSWMNIFPHMPGVHYYSVVDTRDSREASDGLHQL